MWGSNCSTCGGVTAVHVGMPSKQWRFFSTVGDDTSTMEIPSVQWEDSISTVEDTFSTCGVIISVQQWDNISTVEGIRYRREYLQYSGG